MAYNIYHFNFILLFLILLKVYIMNVNKDTSFFMFDCILFLSVCFCTGHIVVLLNMTMGAVFATVFCLSSL